MLRFSLFLCFFVSVAKADTVVFNTAVDGGVYSSGSTSALLSLANNVHGDVQFAQFNSSAYSSISLELSAYALPLSGPVYVYGFDNASGSLNAADFNAGKFLGAFNLPNAYGQPGYFDVTAFVHSTTGAYFGFDLQSPYGGDILCCTARNYGLPPELVATPAPEPSAGSLAGSCAVLLAACHAPRRLKRRYFGA